MEKNKVKNVDKKKKNVGKTKKGKHTDKQVCRDFVNGNCTRESCRYAHVKETEEKVESENSENLKRVCRDFMKGNCTRESCRYIHDQKLCGNFYRNYLNLGRGSCKYKEHCRKNHFVTVGQNNQTNNSTTRSKPRNTESWDPPAGPYDMRILFELNNEKLDAKLSSRDVLVAPHVFWDFKPFELYEKLVSEINECKIPKEDLLKLWHGSEIRGIEGTHLICNDRANWKQECPTFTLVVDRLVEYFGVKPNASRLNWYTNKDDYKPMHHDSSALNPEKQKSQNITIAVSFGDTRDIVFQHSDNKKTVCIPQGDGEVYTFGNQINIDWRHGISKSINNDYPGRISIVIWGLVDGVKD